MHCVLSEWRLNEIVKKMDESCLKMLYYDRMSESCKATRVSVSLCNDIYTWNIVRIDLLGLLKK